MNRAEIKAWQKIALALHAKGMTHEELIDHFSWTRKHAMRHRWMKRKKRRGWA